jgi:hypothetical protein
VTSHCDVSSSPSALLAALHIEARRPSRALSTLSCGVVIALLSLSPCRARADVELRGQPSAIDGSALDALVRLELGEASTQVKRIVVDVKGPRAEIEVEVGAEVRRGTVDLPATDVERTLALFAAELARTSPAPTPRADAPSERPPASNDQATTERGAFALMATMGARIFGRDGSLLLSPRIEAGVRASDAIRVGASARYGFASGEDRLGTIRAHVVSGGLAASHHLAPRNPVSFAHGPRIEAGVIAASGDGTHASAATAFTLSASYEVELHIRIARSLAIVVALDGGIHWFGVDLRADDRSVLDLSGVFGGTSAGLAF